MNGAQRRSVVDVYRALHTVERDDEGLDDDLSRAQAVLNGLKVNISELSRQNYKLEKDVKFLDSRIALLIKQKGGPAANSEVYDVVDASAGPGGTVHSRLTPEQRQVFGQLFFLLQSEPSHLARLCTKLESLVDIDPLLETTMFTIYGNQFDNREEHLLLVVFQHVLASHFDSTSQFSNLLRANTPVSRMMMTYMRRGMGQAYLQRLLAPAIKRITDSNDCMDISPSRVFADLAKDRSGYGWDVPFNGQTDHPCGDVVQKEVERRFGVLKKCTREFMDTVFASVESVPYGLRWAAKQIRLLAQHKFPDISNKQIASLLGAFFFLRYINPAIVTPQAYLLVKEAPQGRTRRNLTMVAKAVQLLANQSTAKKESWSPEVPIWVAEYETPIQEFLFELCAVPDFYDSLELDQYMALQSPQLSMSVPLREIVVVHNLLLKYRSPDDRIQLLLSELGPPIDPLPASEGGILVELPLQPDRSSNNSVRLSTASASARSDVDSTSAVRANVHFLKTKALLVMLRRMLPSVPPGTSVQDLVNIAMESDLPAAQERGVRAQVLLQEYDHSKDMQLLESEVELEASRLGSLAERVAHETASLERVYATVRDRNEYLEQQLDVFRSYISNVRGASKAVQIFTPQRLVDRGIIRGAWPWSMTMSLGLRVALRPQGNDGAYTLTLDQRGSAEPIVEVWLTLDDLLELDRNEGVVDLCCLEFRASALVALVS